MNIPDLPTDNLYKLQSIAGTFLLIASLLGLGFVLTQERPEVQQARAKKQSYKEKIIAIDKLQRKLDSLTQTQVYIYGFAFDLAKGRYVPTNDTVGTDRKGFAEQMSRHAKNQEELERLKLTLEMEKAENSKVIKDDLLDYTYLMPIYMIIMLFFAGAGAVVGYRGFKKWYKFLQVYQDIIVRQQARVAVTEKKISTPKNDH